MQGSLPILVTMLPGLARLVHTAREIVCDFTFKRVSGESNEREVAIFDRNLARRMHRPIRITKDFLEITIARLYSQAKDHQEF
jgi:hypothetical protein